MKVYVGTYNKYNNGSIKGEWLNLSDFETETSFFSKCAEIHKDEKDPEFMFQDHEGIPKPLINESYIDSRLFEILYLELEEDIQTAFLDFMDNQGFYWKDINEAYESFEESFRGNYDQLQDYTDEQADEMLDSYDLPESITLYFDYDKYYYNQKCCGLWISKNGNVFESN